jgi:hypothetical protein
VGDEQGPFMSVIEIYGQWLTFLVTDGRGEIILKYLKLVMHRTEVRITRSKYEEFLVQLSEVHSFTEISLSTGQPMFSA